MAWKPTKGEVDAAERVIFEAEPIAGKEPDGYYRHLAEDVILATHKEASTAAGWPKAIYEVAAEALAEHTELGGGTPGLEWAERSEYEKTPYRDAAKVAVDALAWHLRALVRAGCPVPDGSTEAPDAKARFKVEATTWLRLVRGQVPTEQDVGDAICELIRNTPNMLHVNVGNGWLEVEDVGATAREI